MRRAAAEVWPANRAAGLRDSLDRRRIARPKPATAARGQKSRRRGPRDLFAPRNTASEIRERPQRLEKAPRRSAEPFRAETSRRGNRRCVAGVRNRAAEAGGAFPGCKKPARKNAARCGPEFSRRGDRRLVAAPRIRAAEIGVANSAWRRSAPGRFLPRRLPSAADGHLSRARRRESCFRNLEIARRAGMDCARSLLGALLRPAAESLKARVA